MVEKSQEDKSSDICLFQMMSQLQNDKKKETIMRTTESTTTGFLNLQSHVK